MWASRFQSCSANIVLSIRIIVERTWILSGTPASGLLAVELGANGLGVDQNASSDRILEARRTDFTLTQECKDLESLRKIVTGFLDMRPWANRAGEDIADWHRYIMPYKNGQRKPASLRNILTSLFIRHTYNDIEADLALPPLHQRVVYLEPSHNDKLTQNAFALQLIVNSITSERQDSDYMFHSKNRGVLSQLINNLRQSGFFWTGFKVEDLESTLQIAIKYLDQKISSGTTWESPDRYLLSNAIEAGKTILRSHSWKAFSELNEMGIYVDNFPKRCRAAWSLISNQGREPLLMGITQVAKVQTWVNNHLYQTEDDLLAQLDVLGRKTMDKVRQGIDRSQHFQDEDTSLMHSARTKGEQQNGVRQRQPARKQPKLTERFTVSKAKPALGLSTNSKKGLEGGEPGKTFGSIMKPNDTRTKSTAFESSSEFAQSTLRGTASAKMTYLVDRIWNLHTEEKIIVFYEGDHIAYYIAQALDILGVRYLIYTRTLDLALKSA